MKTHITGKKEKGCDGSVLNFSYRSVLPER